MKIDMEPVEIVAALKDEDGLLPVEALVLASARRVEVAPLLVAEIERAIEATTEELAKRDQVFFGWFLLAEWRHAAGYRPVLRLLRRPSEDLEGLFGEAITEAAQRVLISLFDGDPQPLFDCALDVKADPFVRAAAFGALSAVAVRGQLPRERLASFLRDCFPALEPRGDSDHAFVWVGWAEAVAALGLVDMKPLAKEAFDKWWIDPSVIEFEDFERDLAYALFHPDSPFRLSSNAYEPWDDTIVELSKWHCYSDEGRLERARHRAGANENLDHLDDLAWGDVDNAPYVNPFKDVGRNDPCPCGSGKKYKKCCLT